MAGIPFPPGETYDGFPMHEDGVGMVRTFEWEFTGRLESPTGPQSGFFAAIDGAPAEGYRSVRNPAADTGLRGRTSTGLSIRPSRRAPVAILTGEYGARVLEPLVASLARPDVRVVAVANEFFGGNTSGAGLMVGSDLAR